MSKMLKDLLLVPIILVCVRIDDFKPHFGGGYRAAYRPDIAGLYYISISLNGSTLETSPSNIAVGEGCYFS